MFQENHKDMTQNYPGTLLLMTSVVASVVAALVPLLSGLVIGDDVVSSVRYIYDLTRKLSHIIANNEKILSLGERISLAGRKMDVEEPASTYYYESHQNI